MLLTRVSGPALPVTKQEIIDQLRQPNDEDRYIEALRAAAHDMVAELSGRTLGSETWDMAVSASSGDIILPRSPVQSLTSISFYDAAGVAQTATLSDFHLFKDTDKAIVRPKDGKSWPALQAREDAMTIRFVAGYPALPDALRFAVRLCAESLYDHRMDGPPPSVLALVSAHRIGWVSA